jgi:hypothetical protein
VFSTATHATDVRRMLILAAPVLVVATVIPVFALARHVFGNSVGWYLGFLVYWPVWCILFPLWAIGWRGVRTAFAQRTHLVGPGPWPPCHLSRRC